MFSKILTKLIDESIVPAVLLLATRIVSVVLISRNFGIDLQISGNGFTFTKTDDYLMVNSYSALAMVIVLSVGLFYNLLKSYMFHESHITPSLTTRLFAVRLASFIQSSFDLYSQGSVWLSYSYLLTLVTGLMATFGLLYTWVFLVSLVLTLLSSVLLVVDVENEIDTSKSDSVQYDNNSEYLEEIAK